MLPHHQNQNGGIGASNFMSRLVSIAGPSSEGRSPTTKDTDTEMTDSPPATTATAKCFSLDYDSTAGVKAANVYRFGGGSLDYCNNRSMEVYQFF
ncbi:unnamed protein product [Soboliphyme baturini]|uniref:TLDc domain-containing protein n=1 Tax=Soboliphyme baturini TaxID=241478 RepID=A0A183IFJ4_9BILA|nr:unnamed protein product [Soboliphyme baturini]